MSAKKYIIILTAAGETMA